jgi:hypothetical protein
VALLFPIVRCVLCSGPDLHDPCYFRNLAISAEYSNYYWYLFYLRKSFASIKSTVLKPSVNFLKARLSNRLPNLVIRGL